MPRKKKPKTTTKVSGSPSPHQPEDRRLETELTLPAGLPPLEERLNKVAGEAARVRAQAIPSQPTPGSPWPQQSEPEDEPFTVSGCESILKTLMLLLARWAQAPQLLEGQRIKEGAKLHAEVLNRSFPARWRDKADVVMLGAWWTGVVLDIGLSRFMAAEPAPTTGSPANPIPSRSVSLEGNRKPYEPTPGTTVSG